MKVNKCPNTITGKHKWINEKWVEGVWFYGRYPFGETYRTPDKIVNLRQPYCSYCGIIDDRET